jgi:FMN-dependent NADH-azoreductase
MDWPMTRILYISCSPKGSASVCHSFAQVVVARLMQLHPGAGLVHRDLVASPPPFVDADFCAAIMHPTGTHAAFAASDALIEELDQADAVVIATPMHNYGVPAVLKAWVDQIVRIHRTFVGTPAGKVGRLRDRPVYVVIASGGWFSGPSPNGTPAQPDFLTGYLRAVLNTIGMKDIHFLTLEGVTRGPEVRDRAFTQARAALDRILPGDLPGGDLPGVICSGDFAPVIPAADKIG